MVPTITLGAIVLCLMIVFPLTIRFIIQSHERDKKILLDTIRMQALGGSAPIDETVKSSRPNNFLQEYAERESRRRGDDDE